jgi:phenylpropionate dioxygenase-like ring-hydroxylating dioxygenase large terminal subunit
MLSQKDNELLCRTDPETPMGNLLRRYWIPFLLASELAEPDGEPVRVSLLGERLVAFRDSDGRVGLITKYCAHRNADLFFGRNEECGLRCTYHGWKFDVEGKCVDMPSEDEDSVFKDKIQIKAYPVEEAAGVLFAYMGPPELRPVLPQFEWMRVPESYRHISWNWQDNNYAQAIEGGIDSAHVNYLHSSMDAHRIVESPAAARGRGLPSNGNAQQLGGLIGRDKHPKLFVKPTDYGLLIGARRHTGEDKDYWRLNNFLMPFWTTPPGRSMHAFVPLDDYHVARWSFTWKVDAPYTAAEKAAMRKGQGIHSELEPGTVGPTLFWMPRGHVPTHNRTNDYLVDREMQRNETYTGIKDFGAQDYSIQEGMGIISDRSTEHLGVTDRGIIAMRRLLIDSARDLLEGIEPVSAHNPDAYSVHGGQTLLSVEADWESADEVSKAVAPAV